MIPHLGGRLTMLLLHRIAYAQACSMYVQLLYIVYTLSVTNHALMLTTVVQGTISLSHLQDQLLQQ